MFGSVPKEPVACGRCAMHPLLSAALFLCDQITLYSDLRSSFTHEISIASQWHTVDIVQDCGAAGHGGGWSSALRPSLRHVAVSIGDRKSSTNRCF